LQLASGEYFLKPREKEAIVLLLRDGRRGSFGRSDKRLLSHSFLLLRLFLLSVLLFALLDSLLLPGLEAEKKKKRKREAEVDA
jgi:hypothetical protein